MLTFINFLLLVNYNNSIKYLTPDALKKENEDELLNHLRVLSISCSQNFFSNKSFLVDHHLDILIEAAYHENKVIRLHALKILAHIAQYSKIIRGKISSLLDLNKVLEQNFRDDDLKLSTLNKIGYYRRGYESIEKIVDTSCLDEQLVYGTVKLATELSQEKNTHSILLNSNIVPFIDAIFKRDDIQSKFMATRCASGLSQTVEGRELLAYSNIFENVFALVYLQPYPNKIPFFKRDLLFEAKSLLQKLLLSQTSIDILLENKEEYMKNLDISAKDELLKRFNTKSEKMMLHLKNASDKLFLGIGTGVIWSTLRYGILRLILRRNVGNYFWFVGDVLTGTICLISYQLAVSSVFVNVYHKDKDEPFNYFTGGVAASLLFVPFFTYIMTTFPYTLVPALVGISAPFIYDLHFHYTWASLSHQYRKKNK